MLVELAIIFGTSAGVFAALRYQRRKHAWPSAEARITNLRPRRNPDYESPQACYVVSYSFTVGGAEIEGEATIYSGHPSHTTAEERAAALARLAPGQTLQVYYQPRNPRDNSTSRDPLTLPGAALTVAVGLAAALGLYLLAQSLR